MLKADVILRAVLAAIVAKASKVSLPALTLLQRLLSNAVVPSQSIPVVVSALRIQAEQGEDNVALKILQTVLLVFGPTAVIPDDVVAQALAIGFRLLSSRNPIVNNTASATIRQVR